QRRLHAAPERIDEMRGDHDEQRDGRRALDEPRPHADAGAAPAFGARPLAPQDPRRRPRRRRRRHSRFSTVRPSAITSRTASSALTSLAGSPSTANPIFTTSGTTSTASFSWDTTGVPAGAHTLNLTV